jgi:hypothetical protein
MPAFRLIPIVAFALAPSAHALVIDTFDSGAPFSRLDIRP